MLIPLRPTRIEQTSPTQMEIDWSDGHRSRHTFRLLRLTCKCALCKDAMTGRVLNNLERIPADIHPTAIEPVGGYGLRLIWSDGHTTGIYGFDWLRRSCECPDCLEKNAATRDADLTN